MQIKQAGSDGLFVRWDDGTEKTFKVFDLRVACPCAHCVEEMTGVRRLDPARVPADVRPRRITSVGNYAIQIVWSDGHDTGIYSFDFLRRLAGRS